MEEIIQQQGQELSDDEEDCEFEEQESDVASESGEDVTINDEDESYEEKEKEDDSSDDEPVGNVAEMRAFVKDLENASQTANEIAGTPRVDDDTAIFLHFQGMVGTLWSRTRLPLTQTPVCNIFRPTKQVNYPSNLLTAGDTYKHFITAKITDTTVVCTNKEGERVGGERWRKTQQKLKDLFTALYTCRPYTVPITQPLACVTKSMETICCWYASSEKESSNKAIIHGLMIRKQEMPGGLEIFSPLFESSGMI